jgi:hypothetical protein
MRRWEYCQFANPASGTDAVNFSHQQPQTMVQEFSAALGRGLKAQTSGVWRLHVNLNHASTVQVAGLLGERGWELVGHSVLTGGHEYWTFKREIPTA